MNAPQRFTIEPEHTAKGARYHIIDTEESTRTVVATHRTDRAATRHADLLNTFDCVNA